MAKKKVVRKRPSKSKKRRKVSDDEELMTLPVVDPLQQTLKKKAGFGKHRTQTFRWIVQNDLTYVHYIYREKLANGEFAVGGKPSILGLQVRMLCKAFPLGVDDDAEQDLADNQTYAVSSQPPVQPQRISTQEMLATAYEDIDRLDREHDKFVPTQTPADIEKLRGRFEEGYTGEEVSAVLARMRKFAGFSLVMLWDHQTSGSPSGGSEMVVMGRVNDELVLWECPSNIFDFLLGASVAVDELQNDFERELIPYRDWHGVLPTRVSLYNYVWTQKEKKDGRTKSNRSVAGDSEVPTGNSGTHASGDAASREDHVPQAAVADRVAAAPAVDDDADPADGGSGKAEQGDAMDGVPAGIAVGDGNVHDRPATGSEPTVRGVLPDGAGHLED